jgi:hypothetical protein
MIHHRLIWHPMTLVRPHADGLLAVSGNFLEEIPDELARS